MTDPRIIEVGAEAAYHATPRNKPYDKLTLFKKNLYRAETAAVITAYEAHLKAEGFVVVRAEPNEAMLKDGAMQIAMNAQRVMTAEEKAAYVYRAMLSAATTGENDALPDGARP